ncbi:PAS domain S-box protein [Ohtaekwangia koreensis]|uniref:histidine kinase n=1 Tax=Ohtaekwangia koreensis TaxID=688867 RepID=A0A1T5MFU3_9BACT|nr:PAS domain S-box protein [Ohtaekwangia koreensis]SKC87100.1 PAS domain S-box-containing protein [Ohtaekwangia koreensis]
MEAPKIKTATILLVDDRPENILVLEELLAKEGRIFFKASSGNEALKIALQHEIDLVILDVQMPGMDGFEVANVLKSKKQTKDIPIIFASAEKKGNNFVIKGLEEGAIDYLYKPLDRAVTRAKVDVLLTLQLQKKELIEKNFILEKTALLIDNCVDIIGIMDADTFEFEEVNPAFTAILGYQPEEIYGTSLTRIVSVEDQQKLQQLRTHHNERISFETKSYSKSHALVWLQWNIVNKNNKWFFNARNITAVKEAEKIRNSLAIIVKQSRDATYIHNSQGDILSWNEGAQQLYGYSEAEALTIKLWDLVPQDHQHEAQELMHYVLNGEKIESRETKRITKSKALLDVLFSSALIIDSGSGEKSVAITERDITNEKITGEQIRQLTIRLQNNIVQLEAANQELESFSYSVSHDLRAPLRAVSGYTNILEESYSKDLDEEAKTVFKTIQKNVKKMGQLIDDLLDFSRLGRKEVPKLFVNTAQLVERILTDINHNTPHKATITVHPLHPSYGDHALLTQVWINLISNAIKYSGKAAEPCIEIGSTQGEDETIFYVKDNGAGFDMRYVDKLFGVFQRLHSVREFEGTGIGLAIIKRIISKHGGKVWATGQVNKGAEFHFSLPTKNPGAAHWQ